MIYGRRFMTLYSISVFLNDFLIMLLLLLTSFRHYLSTFYWIGQKVCTVFFFFSCKDENEINNTSLSHTCLPPVPWHVWVYSSPRNTHVIHSSSLHLSNLCYITLVTFWRRCLEREFLETLSVLNYLYPTLARDWWFSWVLWWSIFISKIGRHSQAFTATVEKSHDGLISMWSYCLWSDLSFWMFFIILSLSLMLWNFTMMCLEINFFLLPVQHNLRVF